MRQAAQARAASLHAAVCEATCGSLGAGQLSCIPPSAGPRADALLHSRSTAAQDIHLCTESLVSDRYRFLAARQKDGLCAVHLAGALLALVDRPHAGGALPMMPHYQCTIATVGNSVLPPCVRQTVQQAGATAVHLPYCSLARQ